MTAKAPYPRDSMVTSITLGADLRALHKARCLSLGREIPSASVACRFVGPIRMTIQPWQFGSLAHRFIEGESNAQRPMRMWCGSV